MNSIIDIKAREVLDSRGNPTVEAEVITQLEKGRGIVPSGASTGINEALELRDKEARYLGLGVEKAVNNILTIIKPKLIGMDVFNQELIDETMINLDGTEGKTNLGANAILAVSMAVAAVTAKLKKIPLYRVFGEGKIIPIAQMNILNGGMHADNNIDFQEFMIVPNHKSFKERLRIGSEIFHNLKKLLKENHHITSVGDEGGFAPNLRSNKEALDYIVEAIKKAGYQPYKDVNLALDVAASSFYEKETDLYNLAGENRKLTREELTDYYLELVNEYPIISIEDPFDEIDFKGFKNLTEKIGDKIQIVGDDLFVTNVKLLTKGITEKAGNSILIKINQIGTITETIRCVNLAKNNGFTTVISHRSGETEDTLIADLAVGLAAGQIKTGSLSRGERTCKYNQLLRIEEEINGA